MGEREDVGEERGGGGKGRGGERERKKIDVQTANGMHERWGVGHTVQNNN